VSVVSRTGISRKSLTLKFGLRELCVHLRSAQSLSNHVDITVKYTLICCRASGSALTLFTPWRRLRALDAF